MKSGYVVIVYNIKMKRKLVWHVFFFNVHLLAHQRRNVGGGVEGLCSLLRSLYPSVLRSGAATGDPASGEDSKTLLRGRRSCLGDDVGFRLFNEIFHQSAVFRSDEESLRRRGNKVKGIEDF